MFSTIGKILVSIFGSRNERVVNAYRKMALAAGEYEDAVRAMDDEQLKANTSRLKNAIRNGTNPRDILPEAFAIVREAARRNMDMRHYDVQLIGGNVLFDGKIAEMATGEGKTLVATLAAYLVHLTGKHVHIVTVNDYLAKRDAQWMSPVYNALGLSVGAIQSDMDAGSQERKSQYASDITYGTNNEFGFDYLRDNMKMTIESCVQGNLEFALIDEVDSILIDEARTPLIISGPAFDDVTRYKKADSVVRELISLQRDYTNTQLKIDTAQRTIANAKGEIEEAKKLKDDSRIDKAQKVIETASQEQERLEQQLDSMTQYYEVEIDRKAVHLTHEGIGAAQNIAGVGSFFTGSNMDWPHLLEQGLRAHVCFEKEKDYVVIDGKVIIVDEFTGRLMHGRQWSDGLHQAVEAKEGVQVKEESQTLATITLQNFFKLYDQTGGMTGTAMTEAQEFMDIYKLDVISIPTNKPCVRDDKDDLIYKSLREKFNAIVEDIRQVSSAGRPVLVGTVSIEKSEAISMLLTRKYGIEHEVLNAKQHAREAAIVEKAGHQHTGRDGKAWGNVTIATNMAGRGTDIKLAPEVAGLGGLHIIGTERHESRRIDNQLRGRAGRQGDNGSSQFFLSFDDDLLKIFSPEWTIKALTRTGWEEGDAIQHSWITRGIEKAQKKVEERNFEARKSLLEYDEVMDYQRKVFYGRRRKILEGQSLKEDIEQMIHSVIADACETILDEKYAYRCIVEWIRVNFNVELKLRNVIGSQREDIEEYVKEQSKKEVSNEISLALGEYLEDYEDKSTWKIDLLCKWAMSTFKASLSAAKLRDMNAEEIEQEVIEQACAQIDKKEFAQIDEFLKTGFAMQTFVDAMKAKFDINISKDDFQGLDITAVKAKLHELIEEKFVTREIEYPIDFAMNMVYTPEGTNIYGFQSLAAWANRKYESDLDAEVLQQMSPRQVHDTLLELSRENNGENLAARVKVEFGSRDTASFISWANQRYNAGIDVQKITADQDIQAMVLCAARRFMRSELANLERYVLVQIYDSAWKDHLYAMDHLKESVHLRSFAEKDPKLEYKQEGYKMFNRMLESVEQRVTDTIFKVQLETGAKARNVWNISKAQHDEVRQFEISQRQRAAAIAPQGEQTVRQIKLETPKVGRNDPCPCGSGKKYKKCCGKEE